MKQVMPFQPGMRRGRRMGMMDPEQRKQRLEFIKTYLATGNSQGRPVSPMLEALKERFDLILQAIKGLTEAIEAN